MTRFAWKLGLAAVVLLLLVAGLLPQLSALLDFCLLRPGGQNAAAQLCPERRRLVPPERVVERIHPPPGSVVLDLGAGFGNYSFTLGQAVGDEGLVYASEVDPQAVAFLLQSAWLRGVTNVRPVHVDPKGVDPFYTRHAFDVILAADVFPIIPQPREFAVALKPALKPGTGRLWVLSFRIDPDFTPAEFEDRAALRIALRSETGALVAGRLQDKLQEELRGDGPALSADFPRLLVEDLNRLLEDRTFWPQIQPRGGGLNARELQVRKRLVAKLEQEQAFALPQQPLGEGARGALRILNRLVLQEVLGSATWEKAFALDQIALWQWEGFLAQRVDQVREDVAALLQAAGYELVARHDVSPYLDAWEFKSGS